MLLYHSTNLTVNYLETKKITHFKFNIDANQLLINTLKIEFVIFLEKMVSRKAKFILFETDNISHLFNIEFVEWFNCAILPTVISKDFEKIAWINKAQNIKQLTEIESFSQKVFDKNKEAVIWINE